MNESLQPRRTRPDSETAQSRFALRVATALSEFQAQASNPDIEARLRFAREQALSAARKSRSTTATTSLVNGIAGGSATLGSGGTPWWLRLGSLVPLALLLAGLLLIDSHYTRAQIEAAAEVDAAILADDLPPEAYRDQGFVEFLKTARP